MLAFAPGVRVYLALGNTDMRKAINGLSLLVESQLDQNALSGHLFVFCNRRRTIIKALYWDSNGFCLWQKRLEEERFRWPETEADVVEVGPRELQWLLSGLEIQQDGSHKEIKYASVC
jgi:transposase